MPTDPDDSDPPSDDRPPFFWRCAACGTQEEFDRDRLARYAREGWPVCCGEAPLIRSRKAELDVFGPG